MCVGGAPQNSPSSRAHHLLFSVNRVGATSGFRLHYVTKVEDCAD